MYNCNDTILGEKPVWDATFEKKKKKQGGICGDKIYNPRGKGAQAGQDQWSIMG